jgi:hypothetical protein
MKRNHDLLRASGMTEGTEDELNAPITEYDQTVSEAYSSRRAHTGVRAELRSLSRELRQLVRQLDGIVVYRLRDNQGRLGTRVRARNVAWPNDEPVKPAEVKEGEQVR